MSNRPLAPDCSTAVVVGGGIAGTWAAYKLVKRGIETTLITSNDAAGDCQAGSTFRSAGAINTTALSHQHFDKFMSVLGLGQVHPCVAGMMRLYLAQELEEFERLLPLKRIKIGYALASHSGAECVRRIQEAFAEFGGRVIHGWVTRIVADSVSCRGVQYQTHEMVGKLLCHSLVLASGGYSNLYQHAVPTNCYGNLLGRFLMAGGIATNLEFLFKHGYGNIDTNDVTPTEELGGAEIHDDTGRRDPGIERLLFDGRGTHTHLQAVQLWLRDPGTRFVIDLSFRPLFLALQRLSSEALSHPPGPKSPAFQETLKLFPVEARGQVVKEVTDNPIDFDLFERLKPLFRRASGRSFRVRPLTYFSMGGIGHRDFLTNLPNVYVTGECMHDFGANRVGGLPWGLYLCAGHSIAEQIGSSITAWRRGMRDFPVAPVDSTSNRAVIEFIQKLLFEYQEQQMNEATGEECIARLRAQRRTLHNGHDELSDAAALLLVAEAIMQSSLCRKESRGFFFRHDFPEPNEGLDHSFSSCGYDPRTQTITTRLVPASTFAANHEPQVAGGVSANA